MCGRYAIVSGKKVFLSLESMRQLRAQGQVFEVLPRYNAAPMQELPVVAVRNDELTAGLMHWWLIPHHAKEFKPLADKEGKPFKTFNAKGETLEQSKLFSPYFKGSRCLVPADAFYEWKKTTVEKEVRGKKQEVVDKQPMCIRMKDESLFMFAGLFSVWRNEKEEEFPSYTIITTEPNELMAKIHHRMPVILHEKDYTQWLDRKNKDTEALKKLLAPYPAKKMTAYPVSKIVSNSRNDVAECLEAVKEK